VKCPVVAEHATTMSVLPPGSVQVGDLLMLSMENTRVADHAYRL